jgi:hypothetical protein
VSRSKAEADTDSRLDARRRTPDRIPEVRRHQRETLKELLPSAFGLLDDSSDERIKPVTKSWKVVNCNPFSLPDFRPNQKVTILP